MEESFVSYLLGSAGLTALVGQRIDWSIRPQASSLPQIVLHVIDSNPYYTDEGESGLSSSRIQIDCWGRTYAESKNVSRQVMSRISGVEFSQGGITFQLSHCVDQQDDFERSDSEEFYRVRMDFIVIFK